MLLLWLIIIPIMLAFISYLLHNYKTNMGILFIQSTVLALSIFLFFNVHQFEPITLTLGYETPWLGITLVGDRISLLLTTLTAFLFLMFLIFNQKKHYMNKLFLLLFLLLQSQIMCLFLSNDLFNIYAVIEVSTITVSILIMYKKDSPSIYDGIIYLLTNMIAMTFFLLGIGYIYKIFGTFEINQIKASMSAVQDSRTLILPYTLLMTAVALKTTVMPLFSWLPKAHVTAIAPTVVSAVLSALYVKSGVYLFLRLQDAFSPSIDTHLLFAVLGFMTAFIGFILALSQKDIKLLLAYSSVSQIGLIVVGLSLQSQYGYYGAMYHILNHAVFKSCLFLAAGMIVEAYKTRDITKIRGVFKTMPYVSIVIVISILGITGAPMFNGSVSKFLIKKGAEAMYLEAAMVLISAGTIAYFLKFSQILFGERFVIKPFRWQQKWVIGLLALTTFVGGFMGQSIVEFLFDLTIDLDIDTYLRKFLLYLLSAVIGLCFYQFIYKRYKIFKHIRAIELNFNEIIASMVIFFFFMMATLLVKYT